MKGKTVSLLPFQLRNSLSGSWHRGHAPTAGDTQLPALSLALQLSSGRALQLPELKNSNYVQLTHGFSIESFLKQSLHITVRDILVLLYLF